MEIFVGVAGDGDRLSRTLSTNARKIKALMDQ
jgi:hypothetical protein